jgi:hypothetical protein
MKTSEWMQQFENKLDEEELKHCQVHKAIIKMQFQNPNGNIEIHSWEYTSKDAKHLQIK